MAHVVSLGKVAAASGVCAPWPERTFRFTVGQSLLLTVTSIDERIRSAPRRRSAPASAVPAMSRIQPRVVTDGAEGVRNDEVDASVACARIHAALAVLPSWSRPREVPFGNGLYFFYERGERSAHAPAGRIVRIGNHPRAQGRLIGRLNDHFNGRFGPKNFSVFRRYLGGALMRRQDARCHCLDPAPGQGHWEKQDARPCSLCAGAESKVSELLASAFTFRCVRIDDPAERNDLEKCLIATVAACRICRPSDSWLGHYAYLPVVRDSGLWNAQHVGGPSLTGQRLRHFEELVRVTALGNRSSAGADLSDALLVIPCSGGKKGVADPGLPVISVRDLVGTGECHLLEEGRRLAFEKPHTNLDLSSPLRPAIAYYTGQPYATQGVRTALVEAIRHHGLQCLIISGGYGVLRAEELIHHYKAHLGTQTRTVWTRRLPVILADYVRRQHVHRSYVLLSRQYATCVPPLTPTETRYVPAFTRGIDRGSPMREVPAHIGTELSQLLAALVSRSP
jgi:Peroxide stress protein YaaA